MRFSELLDAVRRSPDELVIPAQWAQGRASFGGLVAALQYEAMRARVPAERPVRSLAITFVGPAEPGVPIRFEVEVLAAPAPTMKHWDECQELPYIKGVTPEFMRHLAMRWSIGGLPFTGNKSRDMGGWVRLRDEANAETVSEAHILALVDAWPPALLPHLNKPAAGSTLTWTIEFVQPLLALSTLDWCKYHVQIEHARDGYGHAAAALWSPEGQLIALSRQTVTIFA